VREPDDAFLPLFLWKEIRRAAGEALAQRRRARRGRAAFARRLAAGGALQLDLGAGPRSGRPGWTTVDLDAGSDVEWDLTRPLPLPDDSVAAVYSSHFLEHLDIAETVALLRECRRVLKPGGHLRVCVPDASLWIRAYAEGRTLDRETFCGHASYRPRSAIDMVNYVAYLGGRHRHMFDLEQLLRLIEGSGFREVRGRDFDPAIDDGERRAQSVYVEASK
jgi:predicted SAM-dependent methyltransferase